MADDGNIARFPSRLRTVPTFTTAHSIENRPQANAYGFAPVADLPRKRFHPADGGAVRLGVVRLEADAVEALLELFQREAGRARKAGDDPAAERIWNIHDDLQSARDGAVDPGPEAA